MKPYSIPYNGIFDLLKEFSNPGFAAHRRHQNYLGAAGGQFTSSPQLLKCNLDIFQPQRIILTPDGGAKNNPHVLRQYRHLYELGSPE